MSLLSTEHLRTGSVGCLSKAFFCRNSASCWYNRPLIGRTRRSATKTSLGNVLQCLFLRITAEVALSLGRKHVAVWLPLLTPRHSLLLDRIPPLRSTVHLPQLEVSTTDASLGHVRCTEVHPESLHLCLRCSMRYSSVCFALRTNDESSFPLMYGRKDLLLDREHGLAALDKSTVVLGLRSHLLQVVNCLSSSRGLHVRCHDA